MCKEWTEQDIQFLKENFQKYTNRELGTLMGRSKNAIQIKGSRLGLKRDEKYIYNKRFFENIDTPGKAYWLGFIYADGCVVPHRENSNSVKYEVSIELQVGDINHLRKFNKALGGNIEVGVRQRETPCPGHINKKIKSKTCLIRLYSKSMGMDLISHGCVPQKSLCKEFPIGVPKWLMRDFIRGYFDGNGTIRFSYNRKVNRSYLRGAIETGSKIFANQLSEYLSSNGYSNTINKDYENSYRIDIHGNKAMDFFDYIYKDSEVYLERKYEKYKIAVYGRDSANHKGLVGKIGEA